MRVATAYLARHAASAARLRAMLGRRLARAVPEGERPDPEAARALIEPVVARLTDLGLLDDAAFARGRAAQLARKGLPATRIGTHLRHRDGVDAAEAGLADSLAALDPAVQATRWAERKRLGPFRRPPRPDRRAADIASLVRAGFPVAVAIAAIDTPAGSDEPC